MDNNSLDFTNNLILYKTKNNLKYIEKSSSCRAVDTLHLSYKNLPVNFV